MQRAITTVLVLGLLALLGGCGSSGHDAAPVIAGLTYSPSTITVGQQATISGSFGFTDDDGDLKDIVISVTTPTGQSQTLPASALQGAAGQTTGTATMVLTLQPPVAGVYTFDVWLTDEAGQESNKLSGQLTAQ